MCQQHPEPPFNTLDSNYVNYLSQLLHGNSHDNRDPVYLVHHYLSIVYLCAQHTGTQFIFIEVVKSELSFHFLKSMLVMLQYPLKSIFSPYV